MPTRQRTLGILFLLIFSTIVNLFVSHLYIPETNFSIGLFFLLIILSAFFLMLLDEDLSELYMGPFPVPEDTINISSITFCYETIKKIGDDFDLSSDEIIRWSYLLYVSEYRDSIIVDDKIMLNKFIMKDQHLIDELKKIYKTDTKQIRRLIDRNPEERERIVDKFYIRESLIVQELSELSGIDTVEIKFIVEDLRDKLDDIK